MGVTAKKSGRDCKKSGRDCKKSGLDKPFRALSSAIPPSGCRWRQRMTGLSHPNSETTQLDILKKCRHKKNVATKKCRRFSSAYCLPSQRQGIQPRRRNPPRVWWWTGPSRSPRCRGISTRDCGASWHFGWWSSCYRADSPSFLVSTQALKINLKKFQKIKWKKNSTPLSLPLVQFQKSSWAKSFFPFSKLLILVQGISVTAF